MARIDELTQRLLGEGLTEAGRMRAAWYTSLVRKLFGDAPASAPGVDIEDRPTWPPVRMSARHHGSVEDVARAVTEGFTSLALERAANHLYDEVWMIWGDGSLRCHPWMKLVQALGARKATSVFAIASEIRTYPWAELRAHVPRPAALMLDQCIGLPGTMLCTMQLDAPREKIGRVMVALTPGHTGWRALNLPIPSIDTAAVYSMASLAEDEWLRHADTVARQLMLHNANQLRSLRNYLMDRIWFDDEPMEAEHLIEHIEHREPPAERLETVFQGTTEERFDRLDELVGQSLLRELQRRAKEIWRRPIDELRPKLAVTQLAQIEPKTQKPGASSAKAVSMMVRCIERDPTGIEIERWRVAGVWI